MELGMIGLGKMGANMTRRLTKGGHKVVVFDRNADAVKQLAGEGAIAATSLQDMMRKLKGPRAVWIMVPSGNATEQTIMDLMGVLAKGDTVIDGGNSNYKDSMRRADMLAAAGLNFVDVGTSGGIWGLTEGYSLMMGGQKDIVAALNSIFETLAPDKDKGWGYVGPHGAGHFVKMVHNGIEYGMMQAYAEGFDLLRKKKVMDFDLHSIAEIWQHGSVVRSWLLDLTESALKQNPTLDGIAAWVPDSGEGRWTVVESIDLDCPIPVITASLQARFASRDQEPFSYKLLAAMRNQFGGHGVKIKG